MVTWRGNHKRPTTTPDRSPEQPMCWEVFRHNKLRWINPDWDAGPYSKSAPNWRRFLQNQNRQRTQFSNSRVFSHIQITTRGFNKGNLGERNRFPIIKARVVEKVLQCTGPTNRDVGEGVASFGYRDTFACRCVFAIESLPANLQRLSIPPSLRHTKQPAQP